MEHPACYFIELLLKAASTRPAPQSALTVTVATEGDDICSRHPFSLFLA
jgi:hypothetical protein